MVFYPFSTLNMARQEELESPTPCLGVKFYESTEVFHSILTKNIVYFEQNKLSNRRFILFIFCHTLCRSIIF